MCEYQQLLRYRCMIRWEVGQETSLMDHYTRANNDDLLSEDIIHSIISIAAFRVVISLDSCMYSLLSLPNAPRNATPP